MERLLNTITYPGIALSLLCFVSTGGARIITADNDAAADFNNIQAAIDAASNGDTIIVTPGTYTGPGNRDIDFLGKAITLRSTDPNDPNIVASTIIDCQASYGDPHRGFYFHSREDINSVVQGFTITNGYDGGWDCRAKCSGAGVLCLGASPTIVNNIVMHNNANKGGGICCGDGECGPSSPVIINNIITGNWGGNVGGGICCGSFSPIIKNNVIKNNEAVASYGGGIAIILNEEVLYGAGSACLNGSSPTIENNMVVGNYAAGYAGGIYCRDSQMVLIGNTIKDNSGGGGMGGIGCSNSSAIIMNNLIIGNFPGDGSGGGIWCTDGNAMITNNTILDNDCGGIVASGYVIVTNCIVRGHWCDEIGGAWVRYSNVEGGYEGIGNIDVDPCFVDAANGDYHLKSQAGRWDANEGRRTIDEVTSPCIDVGDPMSPIGYEPFPNGGVINMGAYGGTAEASKSYFGKPPCETIVAGDINGDCAVNFLDFRLMALHWLTNGNF